MTLCRLRALPFQERVRVYREAKRFVLAHVPPGARRLALRFYLLGMPE